MLHITIDRVVNGYTIYKKDYTTASREYIYKTYQEAAVKVVELLSEDETKRA